MTESAVAASYAELVCLVVSARTCAFLSPRTLIGDFVGDREREKDTRAVKKDKREEEEGFSSLSLSRQRLTDSATD